MYIHLKNCKLDSHLLRFQSGNSLLEARLREMLTIAYCFVLKSANIYPMAVWVF